MSADKWARLSGFRVNGAPSGFPAFNSGDTTGAIAYQFILGGAVPIPAVRGLAMTAETASSVSVREPTMSQ